MSNRKPIIGGNWKMNTNRSGAIELARGVAAQSGSLADVVDVVVFPPFPYLAEVASAAASASGIRVGAQDFFTRPDGAFTGEVSVAMLRDCGCTWALVGHSERRHVIGESDVLVNAKLRAALAAGLNVILCVGETLDQREMGQTNAVNIAQTSYGLAGVSAEQMGSIVIAYEPVWAIGTGRTATPADAQDAHAAIRRFVSHTYGQGIADAVRIQYGGSMKPDNAAELLAQPDIDGGLIGGAALKADSFAGIVSAAAGSVS